MTTDSDSMSGAEQPAPHAVAHLPQMCPRHQRAVVDRLLIPPSGPWQMTIVAVNLACFRATTFDERFLRRTEGDPASFSVVLAEMGCLACLQGRAFQTALEIAKHDGDWKPLFEAAFGKKTHYMWPAEWTIATEGRE